MLCKLYMHCFLLHYQLPCLLFPCKFCTACIANLMKRTPDNQYNKDSINKKHVIPVDQQKIFTALNFYRNVYCYSQALSFITSRNLTGYKRFLLLLYPSKGLSFRSYCSCTLQRASVSLFK